MLNWWMHDCSKSEIVIQLIDYITGLLQPLLLCRSWNSVPVAPTSSDNEGLGHKILKVDNMWMDLTLTFLVFVGGLITRETKKKGVVG